MDLYSIGEMVIDFTPGREAASYIRNAGGAPANVAIAVAKSGLKASMCCKVGNDDFGRFLMDTLREQEVKPACPELCEEAITTMAFVTLGEDGERRFTFARKPGADMMLKEEDVKEEEIDESVIVHAGSCSLSAEPVASATVRAMRLGHEKGKLVSFDVNYRDVMWGGNVTACTDAVMGILPYVDLLKISDEEEEMMGGEDTLPELMKKFDIKLLVETLGSHGARAFFNNEVITVPGYKVKPADTTGAGDAFWGGFLSSLRIQDIESAKQLSENSVRTAMEYGNASGCISVQKMGAIPSIPTREEIEYFLKEKS